MKKFVLPSIVVAVVLAIWLGSEGESVEEYTSRIGQIRKEKIDFLKTSDQSPFTDVDSIFNDLSFFPINPDFKVKAKIEKIESPSFMELGTSTGEVEKYRKFAYAHFELDGQSHRLLLLKKAIGRKKEPIFTAFADNTSGDTTYGGGRYLDLDFKNATSIDLDFNLAYNPYCAYNGSYTCPFPPKENILQVSILAGEKSYY